MHVAVAIVGFRNPDDIARCLTALEASTHDDFEVVICENGGPEAFAALGRVAPATLPGGQPVKLICAPGNIGYGAGVNRCLEGAPSADAWWVLNPDTMAESGAMAALVARLAQGDCDAVGGMLRRVDGCIDSLGGRWDYPLARSISIGYGAAPDAPVDPLAIEAELSYLTGASTMVSRRFLDTTGPLREDYFLYCEEVEWFLRAADRGLKLGFTPDAMVTHVQGTTTGSVERLRDRTRMPVYLDVRNRLLLTRDLRPALLPGAAVFVIVFQLLRCLRHQAFRQCGYVVEGWLAGLRNERGAPGWMFSA